ncbi:MAG: UDP-N-acetylmuramoyl-L-alanine--D-glutamate ligase [Oscillospiraceae bacterium]|nr:UDP-N-acetylmuramoyl-L-alanine--D-glutamate ligase [Oscillospiraceae bacterium]
MALNLSEYVASLKNETVAICGLGVSNLPLAQLLLAAGCNVTIRDKRDRAALGESAQDMESKGAKLRLGASYMDDLTESVIFRTPGIMPHSKPIADAVTHGSRLTSEMEAFFDVCPCSIIAVTGSDGKTTTTSIIGELLKAAGYTVHIGGNIGTPLLQRSESMRRNDIAVLELSSFQLMTMERSPDIAIVTNVTPNHLDTHRDMDEYVAAKRRVFENQTADGLLIVNNDDVITREFGDLARGKVLRFSSNNRIGSDAFIQDNAIYVANDGKTEPILPLADILLPGAHNVEHYMAVILATQRLVPLETVRRVAREFGGVPHRIELVRELRGVRYYNDSIASSPSRTTAGLRSFDQKVILIAGGKDKGVPFDDLGIEIIEHVKTLVLTGLTAERIRDSVLRRNEYSGSPEIIIESDFETAVRRASAAATTGDVVLLSPASTSFDKFRNFEERGNTFRNIVNSLE